MKKTLQLLLFIGFLFSGSSALFAQIADGSIAPEWEVTDLNGDDWALEDFMDDGKHVILDFSATWCGPCWSYHNTHILDDIHDDYGPSGSDELFVFMFEADGDTNDACCYGPSGCNDSSLGNWTNTSYPVVNLTGSDLSVPGSYGIAYYPTLFIINGDHQTVWEVGQTSYNGWASIIEQSFTLEAEVEISPGTCGFGELSVSSSCGAGSVSYQWSNGEYGSSIEVESGTYSVSATDGNGYFVAIEDIVLENDYEEFIIDGEELTDVTCEGGDDGTIYIEINATGDLEYEWSNGDDDEYIDDLEAGTYYLTVINIDNGCTGNFEFTIDEPDPLEGDYNVVPTTCGEENGIIEIFAEGGTGDYVYNYGDEYIEDNIQIGLSGGSYTVVIEDDNGCELEIDVEIPESDALLATLVGQDTISCLNPETTFTVESNSANVLFYTWTDPTGNVVSTENNISVSIAGDYMVNLEDALTGCSFQDSFIVTEDLELPSVSLSSVEELNCNLSSFEMSFANNGNDPVIGLWSYTNMNGELVTLESDLLTIVEPGDYSLIVQNVFNGCESFYDFTVSQYNNTPTAVFTSLVDSETVTITAAATGDNTSETWILDGVEINLQDGIIIFEENGFYELCYLVENECGVAEYCETIEVDGVISSITDFVLEGVSIYTSFDNIIIESSVELNELVNIAITNASGQRVFTNTQKLSKGTHTIKVQNFASGVYFISLEIDSGTHCTKVFKF